NPPAEGAFGAMQQCPRAFTAGESTIEMRFEPLVTHSVAVLVAALVASACGGQTSDPSATDDHGEDESPGGDESGAGESDELEPGATDGEAQEAAGGVPGEEKRSSEEPSSEEPSSEEPSPEEPSPEEIGGQPSLEMDPLPRPLELDGVPEFLSVLRLTHAQWEASVCVLLYVGSRGLSGEFQQGPRLLFSDAERVLAVASGL